MTPNQDEEPVAYLGGQAAPPADAPAKKAPAKAGADKDAPVDGYLGGATPPEELPALPPAQDYQASDFIAAEEKPAEAPADFGAPVEAPQEEAAYDQYAAAPAEEAPPQPEASYFEQQGADTVQGYQEAPPEEGVPTQNLDRSAEFTEPELPKTITQQDAENIIKRITTKKILPPEVADKEGPRVVPQQELTPRAQPGLKTFPIILVLLVALYGTAMVFREQVVDSLKDYPTAQKWVAAILFTEPKADTSNLPPPPKERDPNELRKEEFEKKVEESERRALGIPDEPPPPDKQEKPPQMPQPPDDKKGG